MSSGRCTRPGCHNFGGRDYAARALRAEALATSSDGQRIRRQRAAPARPSQKRRRCRGRMGHDTTTLSEARSRRDQRRFSRQNTHFAEFFKIFKDIATFCKILRIFVLVFFKRILLQFLGNSGNNYFAKFCEVFRIFSQNFAKYCRLHY